MTMGKIAYTMTVAFVACIMTLLAVYWSAGDRNGGDGLRVINAAELAQHDHPGSCWKAIHGNVYDLTEYIPSHPTPPELMYEWCGRDATEAWDDKGTGRGHSPRAEGLLEAYLIGVYAAD